MFPTAGEDAKPVNDEQSMKPIDEILSSGKFYDVDRGVCSFRAMFKSPGRGHSYSIIASTGGLWDHVSVGHPNMTPSWSVMCYAKDLCFGKDEVCVQYHPAESDYINYHPHVLHIWRPQREALPTPNPAMVGPSGNLTKDLERINELVKQVFHA
jgi:hypothetical protein